MTTAQESSTGHGRIRELDGLRGISVVMVVLYHLNSVSHELTWPAFLQPVVDYMGLLGVRIFFVISGFIITSLKLEEQRQTGKVSLLKFYLRRFFRIIPAYWTYLTVVLVLAATQGIHLSGWSIAPSLLFIRNVWVVPEGGWFYGHTWTLSVEEQYYFVLPFCFWFLLRGNRTWMLAASIALYIFTTFSAKIHNVDIGFLVDFKYIISGVILALLWETISESMKGLSVAVPLLLLTYLFLGSYFGNLAHLTFARLVEFTEAIAIAALIAWFIQNPLSCGFLRWSLLQWLGMCSYSLYLWQQLYTGSPSYYGWMPLFKLQYGIPLLFISAAASYYLIERPFVKLGRRVTA